MTCFLSFLRHVRPSLIVCGLALSISIATSAATTLGQEAAKAKSLFDGKTLTGWSGLPSNWRVEDGAITGQSVAAAPLKNNTFIVYEKPVKDFELTCEFKITNGNSGIQYRSKLLDKDKFIVGGYQADIAAEGPYMGINYEEQGRGILAERGQIVSIDAAGKKSQVGSSGDATALATKFDLGKWNTYRVVAKGHVCQHFINGVLMSEIQDHQEGKRASEGILAFQLHAGPPMTVQFKNIMLSE